MTRYELAISGAAGALAALAYIARLVRHGVKRLDELMDLPESHAQLAARTDANTAAIEHLTREVNKLRDTLANRRGRG